MTKIKICGLSRECDIKAVNEIKPEYIGFVFFKKSRRYVSPEKALELKKILDKDIKAVGVFVDEDIKNVAEFLKSGIINIAQLHGNETDDYIKILKELTGKPVIKAFKIRSSSDIEKAEKCTADMILLDAGMGDGKVFDWSLVSGFKRPYFLAGGLDCTNAQSAVSQLHPYALDVSSGVETGGLKDIQKMTAFINAVRKEDEI